MAELARNYSVPVLLAVLLHAFAAASAYVVDLRSQSSDSDSVFEPNYISVSLQVLEREPQTNTVPASPPSTSPPVDLSALQGEEENDSELIDEIEQTEDEREAIKQLKLEELRNSIFDQGLLREGGELQDASVDQESTSYVNAIYSAIVVKWSRPPSATRDMETVLQVDLLPSGELNTVEILESSGSDAFDRSTVVAVKSVKKFAVPKNSELFERRFRSFKLRFRGEDLLR
ncbi:MAG: cell envelope integrity protein TolA [Gammaproteobacteria bacterium]|nr:cell envelope integrity protein TolA [Gammaproteobacteria bacterium]